MQHIDTDIDTDSDSDIDEVTCGARAQSSTQALHTTCSIEYGPQMDDPVHRRGGLTVARVPGFTTPFVIFAPSPCPTADSLLANLYSSSSDEDSSSIDSISSNAFQNDMSFKLQEGDNEIVRCVLLENGFKEVDQNISTCNISWTSSSLKTFTLQQSCSNQKLNHFPRSSEITRKDRLYLNISRMQSTHGFKHFDFVPKTFLLPQAKQGLLNAWKQEPDSAWIVKPVASSRGRGITIVTHESELPATSEPLVACRYLTNPLLVDGFKFDLRLYVAVTSYSPLCIYLFEEGLARFATSKFTMSKAHLRDVFVHLTNYSVNKKSRNYVHCSNIDIEDFGNKWSLSALLQHLKDVGVDIVLLMSRIEDLVIKTILAGEMHIDSACRTHMPHNNTCFELFGFDILVDALLKPWLLEVNLSPSLACESPMDLKIKSHLIADFLTLGVIPVRPPGRRVRLNQTISRHVRDRRFLFCIARHNLY